MKPVAAIGTAFGEATTKTSELVLSFVKVVIFEVVSLFLSKMECLFFFPSKNTFCYSEDVHLLGGNILRECLLWKFLLSSPVEGDRWLDLHWQPAKCQRGHRAGCVKKSRPWRRINGVLEP